MQPEIKGIECFDSEQTENYEFNAPEGEWFGRLDLRAWGKSTNLFLYFSNIETGKKYRLSVFHRQNYKPYKSDINFRNEPLGNTYKITTGTSKNGFPKFVSAISLEELKESA